MKTRVFRRIVDLGRDAFQTALRLVPWPTEPGLRRVGDPGPESPVLVTGNYDLTVRRLRRALAGVDAWVVVANSRGVNVWCAAAGGHLGTPHVVAALKTSGIGERVGHRRAILPQLAAVGVEAGEVARRCGWGVRFGPADAADLPAYLAAGQKKTAAMGRVRFGLARRLEMAAAWGVPTGIVIGGAAALARPTWALPILGLIAVLSAALFLIYDRIPGPRRLIFGGAAVAVSLAVVRLAGGGSGALVAAALTAAFLTAVLTYDYQGSTPIEGGSHFEERRFDITLDRERCVGDGSCLEVCPEGVFEWREGQPWIEIAHLGRCIRCAACIVQCPADALYLEDDAGRRIGPEVVRRFKLNLLGRRTVDAGSG